MDDDQRLRVRLVGRNGRRRYDPVSKDRLVAACLEPGASVARLAIEHGVNANLLWKWIGKRRLSKRETVPNGSPSTSAFVAVQIDSAADRAVARQSSAFAQDLPVTCHEVPRSKPEKIGRLSSPATVSASLPNGVKLTLECGDVEAIAAIIGALGHVQTGR
ncbi:transposase [Rhizobium sp. 2YAF20]|uniref:IS66-like element accessory protein TnpA n=1 Tax=Rhizobium sp. 2YAF20 TaxID=3233027 RepID=UPI003F96F15D